jgi:hypothetical protein
VTGATENVGGSSVARSSRPFGVWNEAQWTWQTSWPRPAKARDNSI